MSAEIVNLRRARKRRDRAAAEKAAAENRRVFGEPKPARTVREGRRVLEEARHEAHRLDGNEPKG